MPHLTDTQLELILSGECNPFSAWLYRRHLKKCEECSKRSWKMLQDWEEQEQIARDLVDFNAFEKAAEATMTIPHAH